MPVSVDKHLECSYRLWWFSKVVIVGSSPKPVASLAGSSWLDLQYQVPFPSCCVVITWHIVALTSFSLICLFCLFFLPSSSFKEY